MDGSCKHNVEMKLLTISTYCRIPLWIHLWTKYPLMDKNRKANLCCYKSGQCLEDYMNSEDILYFDPDVPHAQFIEINQVKHFKEAGGKQDEQILCLLSTFFSCAFVRLFALFVCLIGNSRFQIIVQVTLDLTQWTQHQVTQIADCIDF